MRVPFFNLALTLYSLFWIYTIIGIKIYGGKIESKQFNIWADDSGGNIANNYLWLNYNDFASGLITLMTMMLFNNWQFVW